MFYVFDNAVYPEKSEVLFHDDFRGKVGDNWEVAGGGWTIKDGVLLGCIRENRGGLIYSHGQYPGDIMLDFYGTLVSPCNNDLNFTFRAEGWDRFEKDAGISYIGGLGGWWTGRTGIGTGIPYPGGYHRRPLLFGGRRYSHRRNAGP